MPATLVSLRGDVRTADTIGELDYFARRGYQPQPGTTLDEARRAIAGQATAHPLRAVVQPGATITVNGSTAAAGSTVTADAGQIIRWARAGLVDVTGEPIAA